MFSGNSISTLPFNEWLKKDEENKLIFKILIPIILIQFIIFKTFYPYPNFMPPDSYNYIEAAFRNDNISIWPIGYSKFLRLFSSLTNSHTALVWIQYFVLMVGLLYFLFSIRYLMAPGKWSFRTLLCITVLNPLMMQISNFISSDALFIAISLIWFTQLIWIICWPTNKLLFSHSIFLLLAFMLRYNAMYYPLISIFIIITSKFQNINKLKSLFIIVTLLLFFIGRTQYEYQEQSGAVQFSAFGGWQLAANALYGYAHSPLDSPNSVPHRFKELHSVVNQHMKTIQNVPVFLRPDRDVGVYYLWDFKSPLIKYREQRWQSDSTATYFKKWSSMAPLYTAYGCYLIKHHPLPFLRNFIYPNLLKYFTPPTGFLGYYNLNEDTINQVAVYWFGMKSNKVTSRFKDNTIRAANVFSVTIAIINITFVLSLISFALLDGFKKSSSSIRRVILFTLLFWFINMLWSVTTAPIELRYQLFPMVIILVFMWLQVTYLIRKSSTGNQI